MSPRWQEDPEKSLKNLNFSGLIQFWFVCNNRTNVSTGRSGESHCWDYMGKIGVVVMTTPKMVVLCFATGLEDIRVYQSSVEKIVQKAELRTVVMTEVDADKWKQAAMIRTMLYILASSNMSLYDNYVSLIILLTWARG